MKFCLFLISILYLLTSCKTSQQTMVVSTDYNEKDNKTTLTVFPYGNIVMDGKWEKVKYLPNSKQHFFTNSQNVTLAVSKNPKEKYGFYTPSMPDSTFTTEFYKWESDYWVQQGLEQKILSDQAKSGFIVWQVESVEKKVNNTFLVGSKRGFAYNFLVSSNNLPQDQKIRMLTSLYFSN